MMLSLISDEFIILITQAVDTLEGLFERGREIDKVVAAEEKRAQKERKAERQRQDALRMEEEERYSALMAAAERSVLEDERAALGQSSEVATSGVTLSTSAPQVSGSVARALGASGASSERLNDAGDDGDEDLVDQLMQALMGGGSNRRPADTKVDTPGKQPATAKAKTGHVSGNGGGRSQPGSASEGRPGLRPAEDDDSHDDNDDESDGFDIDALIAQLEDLPVPHPESRIDPGLVTNHGRGGIDGEKKQSSSKRSRKRGPR